MDTLLYTAQFWWNLPTVAKLLILPQPLLFPIQCGNMVYKGYQWFYPPPEKIRYIVFQLEEEEDDNDCLVITNT